MVNSEAGENISIPKNRAKIEVYPKERSGQLKKLYKLLLFAAIGLATSGIVTVLIYPFVYLNYKKVREWELAESKNIFYSSSVLFVISIILSIIFVMRLTY